MKWPGPLESYLAQKSAIDEAVLRVLASGWYVLGPEVEGFEAAFARAVDAPAATGLASGTDALVVALRSLGVGPGDKVATVSHTAVATVAAVEIIGAVPVLVDVDDASMTMDPVSLARTVEAVGGVRAVVPVHLYGHPADMVAIRDVAHGCSAVVVEDCSQAHGATVDGRHVGSDADAAAYSCYPTKNLGALGDAGVLTSSAEVAEAARRMRQYGWAERYVSSEPGINSRLDPVQAAVLAVRLEHLPREIERRRAVARSYDDGLPSELRTPSVGRGVEHAYHQYVVRTDRREELRGVLQQAGVPSAVLYPQAVHQQPAYAGRLECDPHGLPVTEKICQEILCLPMHPQLTTEHVEQVVSAAKSWSEAA